MNSSTRWQVETSSCRLKGRILPENRPHTISCLVNDDLTWSIPFFSRDSFPELTSVLYISFQIIATSRDLPPNGGLVREIPFKVGEILSFSQIHPGRLTWNHPFRKENDLNQTSMIMCHVNLQRCIYVQVYLNPPRF